MKKQRRRKRTASDSESEDEREQRHSSQSQAGQSDQPITRMPSAQPAPGVPAAPQPHGPDPHGPQQPPEATPSGQPVVPGYGSTDTEHSSEAATETRDHIQRALEGTDTTQDEVPDTVLDVLGEGGRSLEQPIQRALEERMDADFSNVRIHTGAKAVEAAEAIDAKAFTCGNDIVFNSGEYDTESPEGQHLLAHELAHVKQQNGGATISMMPQEGADLEIDPDPQLEREADEIAGQVVDGCEVSLESACQTEFHVQRTLQWKKQKRRHNGEFGEYKEEYELDFDGDARDKPYANSRPDYANGQVEAVWKRAKEEGLDDKVTDPNTNEVLEWDRSKPRRGQWDMGHEPGEEYWRAHKAYMKGHISKGEFLEWYRNPDNYRPEAPSSNRSRQYEAKRDD